MPGVKPKKSFIIQSTWELIISKLLHLSHIRLEMLDHSTQIRWYYEIDAHVRRILCHLIFLRHSIRSKAVMNMIFFSPKRPFFLHACACSELPSYISTMCGTGVGTANIFPLLTYEIILVDIIIVFFPFIFPYFLCR